VTKNFYFQAADSKSANCYRATLNSLSKKMMSFDFRFFLVAAFLLHILNASISITAGRVVIPKIFRDCRVEVDYIGTKASALGRDVRVQFRWRHSNQVASLGQGGCRTINADPEQTFFYVQLIHEDEDFIEESLRGKPLSKRMEFKMPTSGAEEHVIEYAGRIVRLFASVRFPDVDNLTNTAEGLGKLLHWVSRKKKGI
jgi:hypothetical protein